MVNEHNAFDLSELLSHGDNASRVADNREQRLAKVDRSGRPKPKNVRAQLDSGMIVKCDVSYDGIDLDGTRRFCVLAEFDWENYHPVVLWVEEYPRDVTLVLRIPGMTDADANRMAAFMELRPERLT